MKSPRLRVPIREREPDNPLTKYSLLGSAATLTELAVQQHPLLRRLCQTGEATAWYGRYGTGKTILVMFLLHEAIQAGRIEAGKVYYVNADDSSLGLATKVDFLQEFGVHVLAPGHLGFLCPMLTDLMRKMIANGAAAGTFIIVDTLKKFVDVMDKKASRAFNEVVRAFVMKGGTFLALAHTNKRLGSDGKPVPEGTGDVLNDFDCAYLLNVVGEEERTGNPIVEFSLQKSRGGADKRALFTYDAEGDVPYVERLCTIRPFDPGREKFESLAHENTEVSDIIEAIELCIQHGQKTKMAIVETAAKSLRTTSRRSVLKVLEEYTGASPEKHRWTFSIQDRGKMVYSMIPRP